MSQSQKSQSSKKKQLSQKYSLSLHPIKLCNMEIKLPGTEDREQQYFDDLLARIRDIRASERTPKQKVADILHKRDGSFCVLFLVVCGLLLIFASLFEMLCQGKQEKRVVLASTTSCLEVSIIKISLRIGLTIGSS